MREAHASAVHEAAFEIAAAALTATHATVALGRKNFVPQRARSDACGSLCRDALPRAVLARRSRRASRHEPVPLSARLSARHRTDAAPPRAGDAPASRGPPPAHGQRSHCGHRTRAPASATCRISMRASSGTFASARGPTGLAAVRFHGILTAGQPLRLRTSPRVRIVASASAATISNSGDVSCIRSNPIGGPSASTRIAKRTHRDAHARIQQRSCESLVLARDGGLPGCVSAVRPCARRPCVRCGMRFRDRRRRRRCAVAAARRRARRSGADRDRPAHRACVAAERSVRGDPADGADSIRRRRIGICRSSASSRCISAAASARCCCGRCCERCNYERLPAYLESTNPRNVPFYESLGFRSIGMIQAGTSPEIVPMLREPQ